MAAVLLVLGVLVAAIPAPVEANPAKSGTIKDTFPPGNNGPEKGAGRITEDGTGTIYVFQTPDDVSASGKLLVGMKVTFENPVGRRATQVRESIP